MQKLLVANRGEVAIRVIRAATDLGIATVAVHSVDDARALHVRKADLARALPGSGVAAYLDGDAIIGVAEQEGCDAIHPGYGFLSENADFARRCAAAGMTFVGPRPETLELFGDKLQARTLAEQSDVPVLAATPLIDDPEQARAFLASLDKGEAIIIKAVAGGGGRGMRVVRTVEEVDEAVERCRSEAAAAFGDGSVYAERLLERARHIEVQIVGDATGAVIHLGERDCSVQRRHQKLVEIAPSPGLPDAARQKLLAAAVSLAARAGLQSLGTFEFLVGPVESDEPSIAFIEANPRLQVEHTVTEEVTGIDLVQLQLRLAGGETLEQLGLDQASVPAPRGFAIQARVNMETMSADGTPMPAGGTLTAFEPPTGPGVRTDTFGYAGYQTSPRYDSLLAKVIAHSSDFSAAVRRTERALAEFRVGGVSTNIAFLHAILRHPEFRAGTVTTLFVEAEMAELVSGGSTRELFFESPARPRRATGLVPRTAGAAIDRLDPLAVLTHSKSAVEPVHASTDGDDFDDYDDYDETPTGPPGTVAVETLLQGTIVSLEAEVGDLVQAGQTVLVMEAMKMEHVLVTPVAGKVREIAVRPGDTVYDHSPVVFIEEMDVEGAAAASAVELDPDYIRPDLALVHERHAVLEDDARPDAVAARHAAGQRMARANVYDLCDPGTFVEYGGLGLPTGMDRPRAEVIRRYPTDGMITGVGAINGAQFGDPASRCAVLAYDYTVLAGTQGGVNHRKTDRLLEVAHQWKLPVVLFTEGGGGRAGQRRASRNSAGEPILSQVGGPGDTPTWQRLGALSGLVPLVGINSGFSFAGNAALLGCCDVIIATANSSIGMGGPALIEGGGLGVFRPEEIGPMSVQTANGVVDVAVADEAEAVQAAKQYLSYFQGSLTQWDAADQRLLRHAIPENRLRIYDVRKVIETLADTGSVLELRRHFGLGMITAFIRIEGRPIGVIANNPEFLAGAVDSDGADKAARFMKLCDAFDIPVLSLCDTPGIMVGPEAERTALVRHAARMFVVGGNLSVPLVAVVLRKAYGLGVMTMTAAAFKSTAMIVSWPTGEFGGMGLEGSVKLGSRAELAAIEDPQERARRYEQLVAAAYENGKAIHHGESFGVDDVIDPADTRSIVSSMFASFRPPTPRDGKKRPSVDPW